MQASHAGSSEDDLPSKRIIVTCDGTWLDADNGLDKGQLTIPSNVTRICRAIKAESSDQIPQLVFYEAGVGSQGGVVTKVVGGASGEGISRNIRAGYDFVSQNYVPGDEIFLLGFSRGAFTARSIAGLIDNMGVLTHAGLPYLDIVFKDFENRADPTYESSYPNLPFPDKPSASNPYYKKELQRRKLTRLNVPIKAVGVWETVGPCGSVPLPPPDSNFTPRYMEWKLKRNAGSLGIPRIPWLEAVGLQRRSVKEYNFYDTSLGNCIENAFQALALDERRASFQPTVWEKARHNKTVLRQVWFPGVHSNVGGGYPDQGIANITLAWMIAQLEPFLDFNPDYIRDQYKDTRAYYLQTGQAPSPQESPRHRTRPWSFGEIYNSLKGIYMLGGTKHRTPGTYTRTDPGTGRPSAKPLRDTNEYVHPSVRARTELDGPGIEDRGTYRSRALEEYRLKVNASAAAGEPLAVWESLARRKERPRRVLVESPLWETERRLLGYSPEVRDYILGGRGIGG
ncbi:hypothetical protein MMC19_003134 [Ptychographa xylographoides]|nr:hypothetical protein [Ptychographa xylographoides]